MVRRITRNFDESQSRRKHMHLWRRVVKGSRRCSCRSSCFFFVSDGMADPSIFGNIERDYEQVSIPITALCFFFNFFFYNFPFNFWCCLWVFVIQFICEKREELNEIWVILICVWWMSRRNIDMIVLKKVHVCWKGCIPNDHNLLCNKMKL